MTKIKLCGLSRACDIEAANRLKPDYIGFVFARRSRRFVAPEKAARLKELLDPEIKAVGVFVNEEVQLVARLLNCGLIDIAQLHGDEDGAYLTQLRRLADRPVIQAFRIRTAEDVEAARRSAADYILLDSGEGSGKMFNWELVRKLRRPGFLAGGLDTGNVAEAVRQLRPFAVDVSSGIETEGLKDPQKMAAFVAAVRKERIG